MASDSTKKVPHVILMAVFNYRENENCYFQGIFQVLEESVDLPRQPNLGEPPLLGRFLQELP